MCAIYLQASCNNETAFETFLQLIAALQSRAISLINLRAVFAMLRHPNGLRAISSQVHRQSMTHLIRNGPQKACEHSWRTKKVSIVQLRVELLINVSSKYRWRSEAKCLLRNQRSWRTNNFTAKLSPFYFVWFWFQLEITLQFRFGSEALRHGISTTPPPSRCLLRNRCHEVHILT